MTTKKYIYKPKTKLEKFGEKIYNLLVENFSQTYFVGGMVRDILLGKKVTDIDIATEGTPDEVITLMNKYKIKTLSNNKKFGVLTLICGGMSVEVATLRKDLPGENRYNEVEFISDIKQDSQRRDFTINSLYLSSKSRKILDFHNGLIDLKNKKITFIGDPKKRIIQDPLRIIRALRFALTLNFILDNKTKLAILNNFFMTEKLTQSKINKEILKLVTSENKKILERAIASKIFLDKHFK